MKLDLRKIYCENNRTPWYTRDPWNKMDILFVSIDGNLWDGSHMALLGVDPGIII